MRPAWSGTIAFGLVTLPVKLYTAVEADHEVAFHLLDSKTLTPIKEVRVNPRTGDEVPWNRIVRGVEVSIRPAHAGGARVAAAAQRAPHAGRRRPRAYR